MAEIAYPRRPRYFACRYVRLLTKKCVANDLGPQVFTLLCVVVHQEDARGYTDPVGWYNAQLMPLVGINSVDVLDRVRAKAVAAHWLHYTPGGKGIPGRYFVTIPTPYQDTDDAPTDEGAEAGSLRVNAEGTAEDTSSVRPDADGTRREPRREPEDNRGTLIPSPSPSPKDPPRAAGDEGPGGAKKKKGRTGKGRAPCSGDDDPLFVRFWAAYPKKKERTQAYTVWRQLRPDETDLALMLAALEWQRKTDEWTKDNGKFIVYPERWLKRRKWEDAPDAPGPVPGQAGPPADPREARERRRAELLDLVRKEALTPAQAAEEFGGPLDG